MQATDDIMEALQIMGKVGLAGLKLGDQVKVVSWYRMKVLPRERKALLRKCSAAMSAPVTIDPHAPPVAGIKALATSVHTVQPAGYSAVQRQVQS